MGGEAEVIAGEGEVWAGVAALGAAEFEGGDGCVGRAVPLLPLVQLRKDVSLAGGAGDAQREAEAVSLAHGDGAGVGFGGGDVELATVSAVAAERDEIGPGVGLTVVSRHEDERSSVFVAWQAGHVALSQSLLCRYSPSVRGRMGGRVYRRPAGVNRYRLCGLTLRHSYAAALPSLWGAGHRA